MRSVDKQEKKAMISLTDSAVKRIKFLLSLKNNAKGLRVRVSRTGCSGLSYVLEYAMDVRSFDEVISVRDVSVFVDKKSVFYIIGTQMDYVEEKFKSGFVFFNPQEKGKCGCGKSFSV